jgi:hypothetical protein
MVCAYLMFMQSVHHHAVVLNVVIVYKNGRLCVKLTMTGLLSDISEETVVMCFKLLYEILVPFHFKLLSDIRLVEVAESTRNIVSKVSLPAEIALLQNVISLAFGT